MSEIESYDDIYDFLAEHNKKIYYEYLKLHLIEDEWIEEPGWITHIDDFESELKWRMSQDFAKDIIMEFLEEKKKINFLDLTFEEKKELYRCLCPIRV